MDLTINLADYLENKDNNMKINPICLKKMILIFNAVEEGWCIKKLNTSYIFTKKHENKKEIIEDSYLLKFMKSNLDLNKIIDK
jgi:hypothetical protein